MTVSDSSDAPAARLATRIAFLVAGFGIASWAPLVPFVKQRLQVDDGTLGLLLLCLGAGSVTAMLSAGTLCARHGCRPLILAGGTCTAALLPVVAVTGSPPILALGLLGFGASLGVLEVAMNVHAVQLERDAGRPLMSGFHAMFSCGAFAGSAAMTFLLSQSVGSLVSALLCGVLMAITMLLIRSRLIPAAVKAAPGSLLVVPRGPVVLLATFTALMFLVEGALLDWGAVFLSDSGLSGVAHAGLGYAAFSVTMTAGRLGGDAVVARWGDRAVMFWGGLIALSGMLLLILAPQLTQALLGFALIGLGAANVVPILFRAAGTQTAMPAVLAVSAISTTGYAGHLLGPAAVGFISKLAGLPVAFWVLGGLLCLVPISARRLAREGFSR